MSEGLYGFTADEFLFLYAVLLILALVLSRWIANLSRPKGKRRKVTDPDEQAILANGRKRFGEAALTRLITTGVINNGDVDGSFMAIQPDRAVTPADIAVVNAIPASWKALLDVAKPYGDDAVQRLVSNGLMMEAQALDRLKRLQALPFAALLLFGGLRFIVGIARGRPVGFLFILLLTTIVMAAFRHLKADQRTRTGIKAVRAAKVANRRLKRAPTVDELPQAVALFGTAVLAGSSFEYVHRLRTDGDGAFGMSTAFSSDGNSDSSWSGSSSSDSGGDSGGSDSGGGCGGCGGCGS
jgi:uncharacterized protein (TIGR04222 family)